MARSWTAQSVDVDSAEALGIIGSATAVARRNRRSSGIWVRFLMGASSS
jgi:hypothetical protein